MNTRTLRNFWLDIGLFLLLAFDIATTSMDQTMLMSGHSGLHAHVFISILLMLGCLVHIGLHWQWYRAVLTGKAKGKIKFAMTTMVTVMMLLAGLSGHAALTSTATSRFHSFTGSMALIGLFIHAVKHTRWVVLTAKRLITSRQLTPETGKSAPRYG